MSQPHQPLLAEIERSFGSLEDFRRTLRGMAADRRHGGFIWLVCTPRGRLRLLRTPPNAPPPPGRILLRIPARGAPPPEPDWPALSRQYEEHLNARPPFPMP